MKKVKILSFIFLLLVFISACSQKEVFTVSFDSQGGTSIAAIEVEKGKTITLEEPSKEGYSFDGWYLENSEELFDFNTQIKQNITLYAKWTINQYTITFNSNGGSSVQAITQDFNSVISSPPIPTKEGFNFGGWYQDQDLENEFQFTKMPLNGITLYAKWTVNQYTVTFYDEDGTTILGTSNVNHGDTAVFNGNIPTKDDDSFYSYTFLGWDLPLTNITSDLTVKATYSSTIKQYTISFNSNGGSSVSSITQDYDTNVTAPENPTRLGFTFDGWFEENSTSEYVFSTMPAQDVTLYAKWSAINYIIHYYGGSNSSNPISFTIEDQPFQILNAIRTTYDFKGWYTNEDFSGETVTEIDPSTTLHDVYLYAKWEVCKFSLKFVIDEENGIITNIIEDYGADISPISDPTRLGYTFDGWFEANATTEYVFSTMPPKDITLYAKWIVIDYNITYQLDGGTNPNNPSSFTIEDSKIILDDPTKTGYSFLGWYLTPDFSGNVVAEIDPINNLQDLTLYAKWEVNKYNLSFVIDKDNNVINTSQVAYGTNISPLESPSRVGYTFDGWFEENSLVEYDFSTMPDRDITLYAKWSLIVYSITYNLNGGIDNNNPTSFTIETAKFSLAEPTKTGYTFSGWYSTSDFSGSLIETIDPLNFLQDITLYAKWEVNKYNLSFVIDKDNNVINTSQVEYGTNISPLESPSRVGYTFDGWFEENSLVEYDFSTMPDRDITLYAKWSLIVYSIIYNLNGGVNGNNPSNYTILDETIVLANPEKTGSIFIGWYNTIDFSGDVVTMIDTTKCVELSLYAKWEAIDYTFTYIEDIEFEKIVVGASHNLGLSTSKEVYAWGESIDGQVGPMQYANKPTKINIPLEALEEVEEIYTGGNTNYVITNTKRVFAWGDNYYGQVGMGSDLSRIFTPVEITNFLSLSETESIVKIEAGPYHTFAITSNNRVLAWGQNDYGKLGAGPISAKETLPIDITSNLFLTPGETIVDIKAGEKHSVALISNGIVLTWGYDIYGQLGNGGLSNMPIPTPINQWFLYPNGLEIGEKVISIETGYNHNYAITNLNRILAWGDNSNGQLGNNSNIREITPIDITNNFNLAGEWVERVVAGARNGFAITSNNRVFAWGNNYYGQLGDYTSNDKYVPTEITASFNLQHLETITSIASGAGHTVVFTSLNRSFLWGANDYGQLGDGTLSIKYSPEKVTDSIQKVAIGENHTIALTIDGRVLSWGNNSYGQLGDGTKINKSTAIDITDFFSLLEGEEIVEVYASRYTSMAITSLGRVFTWGASFYGTLGSSYEIALPTEITDFFNLESEETIDKLFLGEYFAFYTTSNSRILAWGENFNGQLGDSIPTQQSPIELNISLSAGEEIEEIYLGYGHTIAFTSNNRILTWGLNDHGQLGNGTTISGPNKNDITANFGLDSNDYIIDIAVGRTHSMAISSSGRVFTWGNNTFGQLGTGNIQSQNLPLDITNNFNLNTDETVVDVFAGTYNSFAVTSTGRVFGWGYNYYGQLGDGTNITRRYPYLIDFNFEATDTIVDIKANQFNSFGLDTEGSLFAWGMNDKAQLGLGDNWTPNTIDYRIIVSVSILEYNELIPIPTKDGYTFDGWYFDQDLTQQFAYTKMPDYSATVYAKWIKK